MGITIELWKSYLRLNIVNKMDCETAGSEPNFYIGTLISIDYVQGLETATLSEILIPGEDERRN